MKIFYVTASLPYGPSETFVIPEIKEFIRQGHQITIVPAWGRGGLIHKGAVELLPYTSIHGLLSFIILGRALQVAVTHPLRTLGCLTLLLSGSPKSWLKNMAAMPKALWLASLALEHKTDHIHAGWASTAATMAMLASKISETPWSFTAYRWDIIENNLLNQKIIHACFARFISQDGVQLARQAGVQLEVTAKIAVIYSGVSVPPLRTVHEARLSGDKLIAMCPATLIPRKGHRYLFAAMKELRERGLRFEVWLAGQGPLEAALREQVGLLGLTEDVRFLGQVSHDKLLGLYSEGCIDLVVLPSLHEGMSVALIEAMAHAIPVVATHVGGNAELIGDGGGRIVPAEDVSALVDAIAHLIRNPVVRQQMAETGRQRVEDNFSIDKIVAELTNRFEAALPTHISSKTRTQ